jgi:DNA repair exonuclease SbcCD ATPase subunit
LRRLSFSFIRGLKKKQKEKMTSRQGNPNSGNLKDMETKINSLERANFDLKLKLHYLNKKYANAGENAPGPDDPSNRMMMGDTQVDIIAIREENEYSKRRIIELESELLQLQLIRDREAAEFQKALKMKAPNHQQAEENRKREREVAMAIAEHDAALIKKLQEETSLLQKQREKDKELIDTLTNDLSRTKLLLDEREKEIEDLKTKNKDLQLKIELLKEDRDYDNGNSNGYNGMGMVSPRRNRGNSGPPMLFSANTNGQQTSILINSNAFQAATSVGQSPHPTRYPGAPAPSTFYLGTQSAHNPYPPQLPPPPPGNNNLNQSFNNSMLDGNNNNGMYQDPNQLPMVYQENQVLKDRLSKLQESISNQEKIIHNMKTSAQEFSVIESEEIKRLEGELDKILEEKEKIKQKCQRTEVELEITMQQLQQYRRYYGPLDISAISQSVPFQGRAGMGSMGGPSNGFQQHAQRNMLEIQQYERTIEQYKYVAPFHML